jgi:hypothetical protein
MIEALHTLGLWAGQRGWLGVPLPLWLMLLLAIVLVAWPRALAALQRALGALLVTLTPLLVLLCFGLVAARYGLGKGSIAAQEAMLWLHACVFMLGMAWALLGKDARLDRGRRSCFSAVAVRVVPAVDQPRLRRRELADRRVLA